MFTKSCKVGSEGDAGAGGLSETASASVAPASAVGELPGSEGTDSALTEGSGGGFSSVVDDASTLTSPLDS